MRLGVDPTEPGALEEREEEEDKKLKAEKQTTEGASD